MKKIVVRIGLVLLVVIAIGAAFMLGRNTADGLTGTTFYATIKEVNNNYYLADGLEVNDINDREEVYFTTDSKTKLVWRRTEITLDEVTVGATVAITYTGDVLETYPKQIVDPVIQIVRLDDGLDPSNGTVEEQ